MEEATLRAMRPEGLPQIPDTVGPQKENMEDAREAAGDLHEAKSGAVVSVIGGPPCRTVSACRSRSPGPRAVRSEEHPYGFADLTNSKKQMVEGDSVLWLRMMTLRGRGDREKTETPRGGVWARTASGPWDYRVDIPKEKLVSVWRFRAWKAFAKRYEMEMIHFDQGPLGHEQRKPTRIATNLEQMRGLRQVAGPGQGGEAWSENLQKRIAQTKRWSAWAPGLVQAFKEALHNHEKEGLCGSSSSASKCCSDGAVEKAFREEEAERIGGFNIHRRTPWQRVCPENWQLERIRDARQSTSWQLCTPIRWMEKEDLYLRNLKKKQNRKPEIWKKWK